MSGVGVGGVIILKMAHKRVVVSWMIRMVTLYYYIDSLESTIMGITPRGVYMYMHFVVVLLMAVAEFLRIIASIARNFLCVIMHLGKEGNQVNVG